MSNTKQAKSPFMGKYKNTIFIKDQDTKAVQYRMEVLDGEIYELTLASTNMDTNERTEYVLMLTKDEAAGIARLMNRTIEKGLKKE